ncbi:hypothetical protein A1D24_04315 [Testudinibacter aquarius]|nr:hypothetical protein A1D24_04315 [Testudinibacter aquarius]
MKFNLTWNFAFNVKKNYIEKNKESFDISLFFAQQSLILTTKGRFWASQLLGALQTFIKSRS